MTRAEQNMAANKDVASVFVWAPAGRCGTGLLQRLISSSRDILVYGEDRFLTRFIPSTLIALTQGRRAATMSADRLAAGDYTNWSPDALPDVQAYMAEVLDNAYAVADVYRTTTQAHGFPRWGTKLPEVYVEGVQILQRIFPQSRHLFIYRNIHDVMRSYKGRCWIKSPQDAVSLAQQWMRNIYAVMRDPAQIDLLPIQYEALIADPAAQTARIEEFLNAAPMALDVFNHKVNTWAADNPELGHSPTQYVQPRELTPAEEQIIAQIPPAVFQLGGYRAP